MTPSAKPALLRHVGLVVDHFQEHAVHRFGMDEGELAVPERPGPADEGVALAL